MNSLVLNFLQIKYLILQNNNNRLIFIRNCKNLIFLLFFFSTRHLFHVATFNKSCNYILNASVLRLKDSHLSVMIFFIHFDFIICKSNSS